MFIGSDCMVRFLDFLKEINDTFLETIANLEGYEMVPLTLEDEQKHQESNTCVICGRDGFCDNNSCKGCWNCFFLGGKVHHHNHLNRWILITLVLLISSVISIFAKTSLLFLFSHFVISVMISNMCLKD